MNSYLHNLLEGIQLAEGFLPRNINAAPNAGDWINLAEYQKCLVIVFTAADGNAGDTLTLTLEQASSNTGTGVKAFTFTTIWTKVAVTNLQGTPTWTKVTQAAANTYSDATNNARAKLWVVDVDARDLDTNNGFTFLRASLNQPANLETGCLLYLPYAPRYPGAPDRALTALS